MKEMVFKKTPFNGYNRKEVIEYIHQTDQSLRECEEKYSELIEDYERQSAESRLKFDECCKQASDLRFENDILLEEKKTLTSTIEEKNLEINAFSLKQEENLKIIEEMKFKTETQAKLICELRDVPSIVIDTREKDELINDLRYQLETMSSEKAICEEIIKNIDEILSDVKTEAEKIKTQATQRANAIIANAKKEKPDPLQKRTDDRVSILDKLASFRRALTNI